ncbi:MAG: tRNA pseudouridine(55) synthase TruB [Magnetospirillum sp.]
MARKRKGIPIDGWLAIDKPVGIGSTNVVAMVRRTLNAAKVGHGGTLDPLASGILPIALGEATKTVQWVMDGAKTYHFTICFGQARTTDDLEGEVCATSDVRPDADAIRAVLPRFTGAISQVPPIYSAIKVDGERAYDLARAGEEVELKARTVTIHRLELVSMPDADHAQFEVLCGKGTYVRSLARDISQALGSVGHVTVLRRVACGRFTLENAISLDNFMSLGQLPALRAYLLPIETALDDIPALALTAAEARRLQNGQVLSVSRLEGRGQVPDDASDLVVRAMDGSRLVALARIDRDEVRSVRVLNLQPDTLGDSDVDYP